MSGETKETCFDEFVAAREQFEKLMGELRSDSARILEHGEVESLIAREGYELLRRLMQGYLDQRAAAEERCEVVTGADGAERRHCRARSRSLATVFGEVTVRRLGYSGARLKSVFPLDAALNLPPNQYSQGMRRKVGLEVAKGSFEEAVKAIQEGTGAEVPKRQAEELSRAISVDFDEFYARPAVEDARRPVEEASAPEEEAGTPEVDSSDLLVMSTDGKGIVVRKQDLREATRKKAEATTHKLKARLSKGEKRNRKRMATVASVYEVAPHLRTAEQIMGQDESTAPKRPKVQNKRVWASLRQTPAEVIEEMFAEAERRDPKHERRWLVLVDGQEAQQREVEVAIARHRTDVVVIQDFVHVLEYLWKAAYCFHADGTQEAETWVLERAYALLQGKVSDVAAGMRRSATRQGISQEARAPVDKCADYLLKNKERFDYATALANGWPIATGIIEGACRHLVKDRMDLTGARWSLDGAEAVLRLRSLRASGDFEEYMAFHHRQERQRNYLSAPQNNVAKIAA
ncbi:MAG: ISKra4 family transposase [Candidatus Accumulibacter sp.]|uniref:ISKra4 family transposase n=1 Tax=Candidatus Accumulibacter affinis TaxID=2954384 RepID=A0A935TDE7_9PROT|nr:ISKra4 family transposase [Candidatus Accumulibacter affinis]